MNVINVYVESPVFYFLCTNTCVVTLVIWVHQVRHKHNSQTTTKSLGNMLLQQYTVVVRYIVHTQLILLSQLRPPSLPSTQVGCMLCFHHPSIGHVQVSLEEMEQMVSPVIMVLMVSPVSPVSPVPQVHKVGNLPTKVSNQHIQLEYNILSNKYIDKPLHL